MITTLFIAMIYLAIGTGVSIWAAEDEFDLHDMLVIIATWPFYLLNKWGII